MALVSCCLATGTCLLIEGESVFAISEQTPLHDWAHMVKVDTLPTRSGA